MKIGIDARLWDQTGVGRYIQELISNLAEIDKENHYIIFANEDVTNLLPTTNYQLLTTSIRWHSLREQIVMPWVLWREHLDLVHFPYFSVPILYPGKFIVTIHDLILDHFETGEASTWPSFIYKLKWLGYKLVMWVALKRAVKVITVSEATKKEVIDHYSVDPDKITVTYESSSQNTRGVLSETPLRCMVNGKYFLYVGNAYPHKNLEKLLEAILSIKYKVLSIKLVLVGPIDFFYKRLKVKVQNMDLTENIIFYGPADREELDYLYKNALALVFPSLMEGFGLPGLEAMVQGCPVICSDIPVFHEVLGEAALYFNPQDQSDMAEKMRIVCSNAHFSAKQKTSDYFNNRVEQFNKEEMIKKGREQVNKYSWEKLARQTLEIYKSALRL